MAEALAKVGDRQSSLKLAVISGGDVQRDA
jgi:hypothetical protein